MDDPSPASPSGRRGNGLPAADWGALVDLDPRLAPALLERLAGAGVAAFVEPAGAADPLTRAAQLPSRPLERLFVDATRAEAAREVVASEVADLTALLAEKEPGATAHGLVQPVPRSAARRVLAPPRLPGPPAAGAADHRPTRDDRPVRHDRPARDEDGGPRDRSAADDDELFRQIVAGLESGDPDGGHGGGHGGGPGAGSGASRTAPWPAAEDLPDEEPPASPDVRRRPPPVDRARRRRDDPDALPAWLEPEAIDEEGLEGPGAGAPAYVPPPPPPAPRIRPRTLAGCLAVLVGTLLLFAPGLLRQQSGLGVGLLGLALLSGGSAVLVLQVRESPDDSGPSDGAVV